MAPKAKQQQQHSASTESFEHVALDDAASPAVSPEASADEPSPAPAAAVAPPSPAAAAPAATPGEAPPAADGAAGSTAGDDGDSLLPPATQALTSVLNFFGASSVAASAVAAVTGRPPQQADDGRAAAAQQQQRQQQGDEQGSAAAAAGAEAAEAEEEGGDAVEQLEREVAEMAEEVRRPCPACAHAAHRLQQPEPGLRPASGQPVLPLGRPRHVRGRRRLPGRTPRSAPPALPPGTHVPHPLLPLPARPSAPQVSQKLRHGAAEAKEALGSLAQGLSSWWAAAAAAAPARSPAGGAGAGAAPSGCARLPAGALLLLDQAAWAVGKASRRCQASNPRPWLPRCPAPCSRPSRPSAQALAEAAASLGLEAGESVLESFACSLLQTYTSTANFYTAPRQASWGRGGEAARAGRACRRTRPRTTRSPALAQGGAPRPRLPACLPACPPAHRQIAFPGSLHVTSGRLCFAFAERGLAPIKLAAKQVKSAAKLPADAAKGAPAQRGRAGRQRVCDGSERARSAAALPLARRCRAAAPRRPLCRATDVPSRAPLFSSHSCLLSPPLTGLPERLEVRLAAKGQSLVLAHFSVSPDLELDSALALVEHLAEQQG